jgi:hypothetical protein
VCAAGERQQLVTACADGAVRVWALAAAGGPAALLSLLSRFEPHAGVAVERVILLDIALRPNASAG